MRKIRFLILMIMMLKLNYINALEVEDKYVEYSENEKIKLDDFILKYGEYSLLKEEKPYRTFEEKKQFKIKKFNKIKYIYLNDFSPLSLKITEIIIKYNNKPIKFKIDCNNCSEGFTNIVTNANILNQNASLFDKGNIKIDLLDYYDQQYLNLEVILNDLSKEDKQYSIYTSGLEELEDIYMKTQIRAAFQNKDNSQIFNSSTRLNNLIYLEESERKLYEENNINFEMEEITTFRSVDKLFKIDNEYKEEIVEKEEPIVTENKDKDSSNLSEEVIEKEVVNIENLEVKNDVVEHENNNEVFAIETVNVEQQEEIKTQKSPAKKTNIKTTNETKILNQTLNKEEDQVEKPVEIKKIEKYKEPEEKIENKKNYMLPGSIILLFSLGIIRYVRNYFS